MCKKRLYFFLTCIIARKERTFIEFRYVGRREADNYAITLKQTFMKEKGKRECLEHRRSSIRKKYSFVD